MPAWIADQGYDRRLDNFDKDPNTVSEYDAMGTPLRTGTRGWSPVFPPNGAAGAGAESVESDLLTRSQ